MSDSPNASQTQLEASMIALCDAHGLFCFDISHSQGTFSNGDPYSNFHASVQWADGTKEHGRGIASATADTIAEAMAGMMSSMAAKRFAALADEALPSIAA